MWRSFLPTDYIRTYRLSMNFNFGGLLLKVIGVPTTSIQVSRIITVRATVCTLFNEYVSNPNFYITLECITAVSTENLAKRKVTTVFCFYN